MNGYKQRVARKKADEAAARRALPRSYARPKPHVCAPGCEHYRSPLELEIAKAITEVLKKLVPPGARAVAGWEAVSYCSPAHVKLVCSGCIPDMAYQCCMGPNHPGQCYSATKHVHFTPEKT